MSEEQPYRFRIREGDRVRLPGGREGTVYMIEFLYGGNVKVASIRPDKPKELYVACDVGVFMTSDGGTTWRDATGALPNVMIVDLVFHTATRTLLPVPCGSTSEPRTA